MVSHKFDIREGKEHAKRDGDNAKDDDGQLLKHDKEGAGFLEVAYILPYSLTSLAAFGGGSLVIYLIEGPILTDRLMRLR